jgi:hypothetical protein
VQANFSLALEQIGDIAKNGLRYSAAHNTILGQVRPLSSLLHTRTNDTLAH